MNMARVMVMMMVWVVVSVIRHAYVII